MNLNGPGKYDPEAEALIRHFNAECVLLAVVGGRKGTGFDCAVTDPKYLHGLPAILRQIADEIEKQTKA